MTLEKKTRKRVTEEEFEDALLQLIADQKEVVKGQADIYDQLLNNYYAYIRDKSKFRLEYFQEGTTMFYTKNVRSPPGFKSRKNEQRS